MKLPFKKINPGAVTPKKATTCAAAYDLSVPEDVIVKPGRQIIPLGIALEMENDYQALVEPRSGFSSKGMEGYHVLAFNVGFDMAYSAAILALRALEQSEDNSLKNRRYISVDPERFDCDVIQGKIDADYRDGIGVILNNRDKRTFMIKAGTRIAQLTFLKVENVEWEEVDTLSETDREGGFGSTGTGA